MDDVVVLDDGHVKWWVKPMNYEQQIRSVDTFPVQPVEFPEAFELRYYLPWILVSWLLFIMGLATKQ